MSPIETEHKTRHENPDIKPGPNYEIWNTPQLLPQEFKSLQPEDRLIYLATLGHLAMSTHNTQPWAFEVDKENNQIDIFLDKGELINREEDLVTDKRRVLPLSDEIGRQSSISIGCAVANMIVGAEYYNLNLETTILEVDGSLVKPIVEFDQKEERYVKMASIKMQKANGSHNIDRTTFESMFTRRVNRSIYKEGYQVDSIFVDKCKKIASENTVSLTLLSNQKTFDRKRINFIGDKQQGADSYVVNNPKFRDELAKWFKTNNTDSFLGMPGDTFCLDDKKTKDVYNGLLGNSKLKAEDLAGFIQMGKKGIESSSLVGIITTERDCPENWVRAGITLQKIANLTEANNLGFAVHAALAEVNWVSKLIIKPLLLEKHRPVILFRIGEPFNREVHSPRLPFNNILKK